MRRRATIAVLLVLAAIVCVGCGVADPYNEKTEATETSASRPRLPRPSADGEQPVQATGTEPGAGSPAEVASGTPAEVARQVATLAENWSSATAPRAFSELAAVSVGAARTEFRQVAATARTDVQETLGYDKSQATVESVAVKGNGDTRHAIVVVHRRISSSELPNLPAEYKVTLITLRRLPGGWAVSSWAPQP